MLSKDHIEQLEKESGISSETLEKSGVVTTEEGIVFNYLHVETGEQFGTRVKLNKPTKDAKYLSEEGAEPGVYFHPEDLEDLHETSVPLVIAEGEKKALKGHQEIKGYVVTGIPGCWGFSHNKELSPQWKKVPLEGRKVFLCPDTDFKTNNKVLEAVETLVINLEKQGAEVHLIDLSIDGKKEKIGLDDFLMLKGSDELHERFDNPMWVFGAISPEKYPKKATEKEVIPILSRLIFTSELNLDPIVSSLSKRYNYRIKVIRKKIRELRDAWKEQFKKRSETTEVPWNKSSTGNTKAIDAVIKALEKEDEYFLYGDDRLLATIRNGELKIFTEPSKLAHEISARIDFKVITQGAEGPKQEYAMFPPSLIAGVIINAKHSKKLRHIEIVTKNPVLLGNNVYYKPGYYPKDKLLYIGEEVKRIRGLKYTKKALNYPFEDNGSWINALGLMVGTTFLRTSMPGEHPSIILLGDDTNLGKTAFASTLSIIAIGKRVSTASLKQNEDEMEKELGSRAEVSDFIILDNVRKSRIASAVLERLITDKTFETRRLGASELISRRNDMQVIFTSNGGGFSKDLVVRSVPIFFSREKATSNESLLDYVEDNKEIIRGELLNLVLDWLEKGSPLERVRFDKFQKWADKVNGILMTAGVNGFLSNFEEVNSKLDPFSQAILDVAIDEILESEDKKTRAMRPRGWRQKLESSGYSSFFKETPSLRGKDIITGTSLRKLENKEYPVRIEQQTIKIKSCTTRDKKHHINYYFEMVTDGDKETSPISPQTPPNLSLGKIEELNQDVKEVPQSPQPISRYEDVREKEALESGGENFLCADKTQTKVNIGEEEVTPHDCMEKAPQTDIGKPLGKHWGNAPEIGENESSPLWWQGEYIGDKFAFDTETTLIEHEGHVPDYILGSAYNGSECYFIRPEDLKAFSEAHKDSTWIMHNASFDMTVVEKVTGNRELFFNLIDSRKVCDSMLLAKLLHIAKGGNWNKKTRSTTEAKNVRESFSLAAQAKKVLGIDLDKTQEVDGEKVRLSYEKYKGRIDEMPQEYLDYNSADTKSTYRLWEALKQEAEEICDLYSVDKSLLLSHWTEVEKAYAARLTSLLGVRADEKALDEVAEHINEEYEKNLKHMTETYGYYPGSGESDRFQAAMKKADDEAEGVELPKKFNKTKKAEVYSSSEKDLKPKSKVPFIADYLKLKKAKTLRNTFANKLKSHIIDGKIHPKITTCLDTGRVSFSKPNLQQIPRPTEDVDLRKFILPPYEGHVFYGVDNSAAELVALGDRLVRDFGNSKMSEAINEGKDLHKLTATTVTGKKYEEVTKGDRQLSKALNFGFPGGLGVRSFVNYAETSYGVKVSEEEAAKLKEDWFQTYPEMRQYMKSATQNIVDKIAPFASDMKNMKGWQSYYTLKDIAAGKKENKFGFEYTEEEIDWAWNTLRMLSEKYTHVFTSFHEDIGARNPSEELSEEIEYLRTAILPSGRIRGKCNYNNFLNNSFQGAQADIAGTAWYKLWRNGYEVAHMVHDEVQVSLPNENSPTEEIDRIILDAAKKWCPNTTMRIESEFSPHWKK